MRPSSPDTRHLIDRTRRLVRPGSSVPRVLAVILLLTVVSGAAQAATVTWDGGAATTNWFDATNWDSDTIPVTGDDVDIPSGAIVVYEPAAPGGLVLGRLDGTGSLTIRQETLAVSTGSVFGGSIDIESSGRLQILDVTFGVGTLTLTNGVLEIAGTESEVLIGSALSGTQDGLITGEGRLVLEASADVEIFGDTTSIEVGDGVTIENQGDLTTRFSYALGANLVNSGTWTIDPSAVSITITSADNAADPPIKVTNFGTIEFLGDGRTIALGRLDFENHGSIIVGDGSNATTVTTLSGAGSASVRPALRSISGSVLRIIEGSEWDGSGFRGDLEVPASEFIGYGFVFESGSTLEAWGTVVLGGALFEENCSVTTTNRLGSVTGFIELAARSGTLLNYSTFEGTQTFPNFVLSSGIRVDDGSLTLGGVGISSQADVELLGSFDPLATSTLTITDQWSMTTSGTPRDVYFREGMNVIVGNGVDPAIMESRWSMSFEKNTSLTIANNATWTVVPSNSVATFQAGGMETAERPQISIDSGARLEFVTNTVTLAAVDFGVDGTVAVESAATVESISGNGSGLSRATFDFNTGSRLEIDGTFDAGGFANLLLGPDGQSIYGVVHDSGSTLVVTGPGLYVTGASAFADGMIFGDSSGVFEFSGSQRSLIQGNVVLPEVIHRGIVVVDGELEIETMRGATDGDWIFRGVVGRVPSSTVTVTGSLTEQNTSFSRVNELHDEIVMSIGNGVDVATAEFNRNTSMLTGSRLVVESNATLTAVSTNNTAFDLSGNGGLSFENRGTFVVDTDPSGAATTGRREVIISLLEVVNDGLIHIQSGELILSGTTGGWTSSSASTLQLEPGTIFDGRSSTAPAAFEAGSQVVGPAATVTVRNGFAACAWNVGTTEVGGGSFSFDHVGEVVTLNDLTVEGDLTITDPGTVLQVDGNFQFASGEISGPGELHLAGDGEVNPNTGTTRLRNGLTFSVEGAIDLNGGNFILQEGSTVHVLPTGTLRLQGGGTRFLTDGSGVVELVLNEGTLEIDTSSSKPSFGPIDLDTPGTLVVGSLGVNLGSVNSIAQFDVGSGALTGGTWILSGPVDGLPGDLLDNQTDLQLLAADARFTSRLGSWTLNSGNLALARSLNFSYSEPFVNTGTVELLESAQISPAFTNDGFVQLPPDVVLTVAGEYEQTTAGQLTSEVDPVGAYGSIAATSASLAGGVGIQFDSNPEVGDEFALLTYASVTGDFTDESQLPATGPLGFPDLEWVTEVASTQYLARIQGYYNAVALDLSGPALQRVDPEGGLDDVLGTLTLSSAPTSAGITMNSSGKVYLALLDDGISQSVAAIEGLTNTVIAESTPAREIAGIAIPPEDLDFDPRTDSPLPPEFGTITVSVVDPTPGRAVVLGELNFDRGTVERPVTIVFPGGVTDPEAELLAYAPDGSLYALDNTGSGPRLWLIDLADASATLVGTAAATVDGIDGMAFLGEQLFASRSSTGEVYQLDPSDASLVATTNVSSGLAGLASRACYEVIDGLLITQDVPADVGGQVSISWTETPEGATAWSLRRAVDPCALVLGRAVTVPGSGVGDPATVSEFVDATVDNYTTYHYRLDFFDADGAIVETFFGNPVFSYPNIVLSELSWPGPSPRSLSRRVGEQVELQNLSADPVDLANWRLSNGTESEALTGVISGDGFLVWTLTTMSLDPNGDTLTLLPPASNFRVDALAYGIEGGAPSAPDGFTVSRVPGTTADDPVSESFSLSEPTLGAENLAQAPALGSSLVINEISYTGVAGEDYLELFNPLGSTVRLDRFAVTDGVSFIDTLQVGVSLDAGDLIALESTGPVPFDRDLVLSTLYLYRVFDDAPLQLVDQIGWGPGAGDPSPPDPVVPRIALTRVPDGIAVFLGDAGTNWLDCGGGDVLAYGLPSPGLPNIPPELLVVSVDASGGGDYADLATAIAEVTAGTALLLEPGQYEGPVVIPEGVSLLGNAPRSSLVIVGNPVGGPPDPTVTLDGNSSASRLANLTISSSRTRALDLVNSNAMIQSVRFADNRTEFDGGAVRITGGSPRFEGCTFLRNASEGDGGAVLVEGGSPTFEGTLFFDNDAEGAGGAIFVNGGTVSVRAGVFEQNESASGTGIVHAAGGEIDVKASMLTNSSLASAMQLEGPGVGSLTCSIVFANDGGLDTATLEIADVVDADPQYCSVATLDFGYPEGSPADVLSTSCGVTVGITGAGCAEFVTSTPDAPPALLKSEIARIHPNPFNPRTSIAFTLSKGGRVDMDVFDSRGRLVHRLVDGQDLGAGPHRVVWTGVDDRGVSVASGLYLVRLRVEGEVAGVARKMILVR